MERFYEFAGLRMRVRMPQSLAWQEDTMLDRFAAQPGSWDRSLEITVVDDLALPEGELIHREEARWVYSHGDTQIRYDGAVKTSLAGAYLRIASRGTESRIQVKRSAIPCGITSKLVLTCMEAEHWIIASGGILLHTAWIEYRGKAIAFTAPSGTGKSTQAELWRQLRGARVINGDRGALFPLGDRAEIRGIPFCGSSGVSHNVTLPLAAVVYLSQAPKTEITPLRGAAAFRSLWEGCSINTWNSGDIARCTQTVMDLIGTVPLFHLACTPDETAVMALEKELAW